MRTYPLPLRERVAAKRPGEGCIAQVQLSGNIGVSRFRKGLVVLSRLQLAGLHLSLC
jgi:hypothetical protein